MDRGWGVVSFIQYVQLSVFNNTYKLATIGKDSMITSSNMYLTVNGVPRTAPYNDVVNGISIQNIGDNFQLTTNFGLVSLNFGGPYQTELSLDASYAKYATIRAAGSGGTNGVALDKDALAATLLKPTTALPQGRQFALNPAMKGLTNLFNTGKAAVQLNVGPLIVPLTRDQYNSSNRVKYPLPPKLFSHNDQQSVWQSSSPEGSTIGWGGKMGDVALSNNSDSLFTCISLSGNSVLLAGDSAQQYQCSTIC